MLIEEINFDSRLTMTLFLLSRLTQECLLFSGSIFGDLERKSEVTTSLDLLSSFQLEED